MKLLYPLQPSNERPKGDPNCYTNPGNDTSLTRTGGGRGSEGRQKACVRVAQLCDGYLWRSSRKIQLVDEERSCLQDTQLRSEKKTTRVESDAGRDKTQAAREGVWRSDWCELPHDSHLFYFTRCGERITMLMHNRQHPYCHHGPLLRRRVLCCRDVLLISLHLSASLCKILIFQPLYFPH